MSQSRFWLSTHSTYQDAADARDAAILNKPEGVYQIRKGDDGSKQVFRLIERFKANEVRVIQETRNKKRRKSKTTDLSWIRNG